jgi:hypothetical protein
LRVVYVRKGAAVGLWHVVLSRMAVRSATGRCFLRLSHLQPPRSSSRGAERGKGGERGEGGREGGRADGGTGGERKEQGQGQGQEEAVEAAAVEGGRKSESEMRNARGQELGAAPSKRTGSLF